LLALLLLLVSLAAVALVMRSEESAPARAVALPPPTMSAEFAKSFDQIRAGEQVTDSLAGCLAIPDPPWMRWDPSVIAAYCRALTLKHISLDEIKAALDNHQFERLDRTFASYLADNYQVPERHGILARTYRNLFSGTTSQVREIVKRWVDDDPASAYALAARGTYYQSASWDARGSGWARDTPEKNFENMHRFANLAIKDLREALRREPRLIAAYEPLIHAGLLNHDSALIEESIKAALDLDPAEERIYRAWTRLSEPRWGGSVEAMAYVAQEAEKHADKNPVLKLITEKRLADKADAKSNAKDFKAALELYDAAFASGPSAVDMISAGYAASVLGQHEKAIWYLSESYRFGGGNDALLRRASELNALGQAGLAALDVAAAAKGAENGNSVENGRALVRAKRLPEAEKVFLAALRPNHRDKAALVDLIVLYIGTDGLNQPDKAQPYLDTLLQYYPDYARGWLLAAAMVKAKHEDESKCLEALRKYLALVDESDPYEKSDIAHAKQRVAELERQFSKG
jgi:tetratricopeptide (TPR) repeat protein